MEDSMIVKLPAHFLSVGQFIAQEGWVHPNRTLNSNVLIVVESGCMGIAVDQSRYTIREHQAILLPTGKNHVGFNCDDARPPKYYWTHFLENDVNGSSGICLRIPPTSLTESTYNSLVIGFHQLINESSLKRRDALMCDYRLSLLLIELQSENREMPKTAVANRMLEYIRLHCFEKLTLGVLAKELGYTEDYLSRLFHENADCSFRQYIHRLRMQKAKMELVSSAKTVQEIAMECGYSNAKFFSTAFFKCEGITPTAYRNMFSGLHQNNA